MTMALYLKWNFLMDIKLSTHRYIPAFPSSFHTVYNVCQNVWYLLPSSRNRVRATSCGYAIHEATVFDMAPASINSKKSLDVLPSNGCLCRSSIYSVRFHSFCQFSKPLNQRRWIHIVEFDENQDVSDKWSLTMLKLKDTEPRRRERKNEYDYVQLGILNKIYEAYKFRFKSFINHKMYNSFGYTKIAGRYSFIKATHTRLRINSFNTLTHAHLIFWIVIQL